MSVLIVYATIEGQTGKIAKAVENQLGAVSRDVVVFETEKKAAEVSFEGVDKVILAAPVHERRHPQTFEVFLIAHRAELQACDTLLLSVSLNAAFPEGLEEAGEYVTELQMRTQFTPDTSELVAGAVRTDTYDYYATQVLRHVVLRDQENVSSSTQHEFTDWDALASAVLRFVQTETACA